MMSDDSTILAVTAPQWFLVNAAGRRIPVEKETVVGREAGCDLVLEEGRCSRRHARLVPRPDGLQVVDLGSSNGTFHNGERLTDTVLRAGDEVAFDTVKFRVEAPAVEEADATILAPRGAPVAVVPSAPAVPVAPVPVAPAPAPAPAATASAPAPVAAEPAAADAAKNAAWWAPRDEGPEGTMLMGAAIVGEAPVEGTMVMAAMGASDPVLVGLSGSVKGKSFKLSGDRWKIGRDGNECDVCLDDGGVSAFHAQLIHEGDTWKLVNLMSSNGSFVNGERVQTAYLSHGDRLRFGSTELILNLGGGIVTAAAGQSGDVNTVTVGRKGIPVWVWGAVAAVLAGVVAWFVL